MNITRKRLWKSVLQAVKVAVGSSFAIWLARALGLSFAASAGTIAMLTILTTKWETVRLSGFRILTFVIAVFVAWITISRLHSEWLAYGIFMLVMTLLCDLFGWMAALSVNAVIGTHFLETQNFTAEAIRNEFCLLLIGISIALVLNLFHNNRVRKKDLIRNMRYVENRLQMIMGEIASYLSCREMERNVWEDIIWLEDQLREFIRDAHEYQDNTFHSHPGYYIDYFEMRLQQCGVLHNLHYEMKKIRNIPVQARVIAEFVLDTADYVIEKNVPTVQIQKLDDIFLAMKDEPLPVTREEFESRALLYHILMDLEEFLVFKKRFVEGMDETQRKLYWESNQV